MRYKIAAIILSVSLLFTSTIVDRNIYADNITEKETNQENPVLLDFMEQSKEKNDNKEKMTIIVEINDDTMNKEHGLEVPDISKVRTKEGLSDQLDYASKSQDILLNSFDEAGASYKVVEVYDTVLNGVAITTNFEDAKKIAALPEVESVEINRVIKAPEVTTRGAFKALDNSSNEMINSETAWNRHYSGKGQLIAIIDSGADPEHEVFKNFDKDSLRIKNEGEIKTLMASKEISGGTYFNDKIPFGFNYADRNLKIKENKRKSHGMHVAGIVAGNGEKLKGVAPNAQLAIMRVFSDSAFFGGTTPAIYNKAIDDAVKLGVDSINMSLGSTGTTDGRMEQTTINALKNAQEAGIVVAIAIGNDAFMGFGAIENAPSTNPDIGLTNSPGVADLSLAVASVDNVKVRQRGILVNTLPATRFLFMPSDDKKFPEGNQSFIHINEAYEEDVENLNLSGKIALIKRGDKPGRKDDYSFAKKIKNAQDKGAIAAIVYNNVDERLLTHMAGLEEGGVTIPSCFISKKDGEFLVNNPNLTINIETEESLIANPNAYKVSSFSSWGVSPEGNLKPDISAPGGDIYSSLNDDTYDLMSGTSMASPHVSGGIAVVKEYVEKNFGQLSGVEKHQLIKNLLMSTASPHLDSETKAYTSPRGQGAGLLNLNRATRSSVVVLGTNDISSINLRNISTNDVNIKGKLKNYSNENKEFQYYAVLNTDTVKNGKALLQPRLLQTTENQKKTVVVPAKSTVDFSIDFNLTDEDINELQKDMPNGFFLEGYVFFESNDIEENINVPFVGFKGVWNDLKVIEDSIYTMIKDGKRPYYYERANVVKNPFTYIASKSAGELIALGELEGNTFEEPKYDETKIAFSPNSDGRADDVIFVGTFLRNYKDFELSVYREDNMQEPLFKVAQQDDFGLKNYYIPGFGGPNLNTTKNHWKWNGKNFSGEMMEDGKYILSVKVKPDGKDESIKYQTVNFPITIDTSYPRIVKSNYNKETGEYSLEKLEEEGSGLRSKTITIDKEVYTADENDKFTLPKNADISKAILKISDHAHNTIEIPLDKSIRRGDEKTVLLKPVISTGSVPMNKFRWTVYDENENIVDPYDMKVGSYTLVVFDVEEPYEVEEGLAIEFDITEEDKDKIITIPFSYKNKKEVTIAVTKPNDVFMQVILIDKLTGMEYPCSIRSKTQYSVNVPPGNYTTIIRELSDKYFANIELPEVKVDNSGVIGTNPVIIVTKKIFDNVQVNVDRNGYKGELKLLLYGKDAMNTRYEVIFEDEETQKTISIPYRLKFDVYITNIQDNTYGADALPYELARPIKPIDIKLEKGVQITPVPVNKDMLLILINKALNLKEKDYEIVSWSAFELELEKAENIYKESKVTQEQVNEAYENLKKAIENLVGKGAADKTRLKEKIEEALEIYNNLDEKYDEKSKEFLITAIEGARMVLNSKDPILNTEKHIQDTIDMLDRAIKNIKRKDGKVDKVELGTLLKQAEELIKNQELYTEESIENLKQIYENAKEVYSEESSNYEEVKEAVSTLRTYIELVQSKADRTMLKEEIEKSDAIDLSQYKLKGKTEFRTALEKAKSVLKNKRALENEIKEAYEELKQKREALVEKGDLNLFEVPVRVKNIDNDEFSIGDDFLFDSRVKVEKNNDKYVYTIKLKSIDFELNGEIINADITKFSIVTKSGKQDLTASRTDEYIQYIFDSDEKLSNQEIEFVIDVYEEIGADALKANLHLDWSKAI